MCRLRLFVPLSPGGIFVCPDIGDRVHSVPGRKVFRYRTESIPARDRKISEPPIAPAPPCSLLRDTKAGCADLFVPAQPALSVVIDKGLRKSLHDSFVVRLLRDVRHEFVVDDLPLFVDDDDGTSEKT